MPDTIREFLVSYAFGVDSASRSKAEAETKAAEDRITAANAAALAKRVAAENAAQATRIAAAIKAGQELTQADRRFVAEQEKRRIDAADAEKKRREEDRKRNRERLDDGYKEAQAQALRLTSLAIKTVAAFDIAKLVDNFTVGAFSKLDATAKQFERLNYLAQNTGGSVQGINAVVYALSQLGTSAQDAESSFSAFGSNLSKYRAFEDILKSMGIATRDVNGQLRDSSQLFQEYLTKLSSMPRAQREAMGGGWGISEATIQAGSRPQFGAYVNQARADQAAIGSDANAASQSGLAFSVAMRHVNNLIDQVKTSIADVLFRTITPQLNAVAEWLKDNGKTVSEVISSIASGAEKLAASLIRMIAGNDSVKDAMTVVSDALIQFGHYIGSEDFKKTVKGFVSDVMALARSLRWALEKVGIMSGSTSSPAEDKRQEDLAKFDPSTDAATHGEGMWNHGFHGRSVRTALNDDDNLANVKGKMAGFRANNAKLQANAFAITDELRKAGVPDEGIAASLGSAQTESGLNPAVPENDFNRGHHGLWQWDSTRWPKIVAWIKSQGGDPMDARWQTRAHIAEGRAKPGDAIYDGPQTSEGFHKLETSKGDLGRAVEGMRGIERFGRGEEGGRAANAGRWLGHLPTEAPTATAATGAAPNGEYPEWMDERSKRELAGINADLAKDLLAAAKETGMRFKVAQGLRSQAEADANARSGRGVSNSQHLYGAAADIHLLDANGNVTYDRDAYQRFAGAFTKHSRSSGGNARWLGGVGGRWASDIVHFDQGIGYGQSHARNPYGTGGPTKDDIAEGNRMAYTSPANPFLHGAAPAKVEVTDASAFKLGKAFVSSSPLLQMPRSANTLGDIHASWQRYADEHGKTLHHPGLMSPSEVQRKNAQSHLVRHGDRSVTHNPTFNIHTSDAKSGMSAAQMVADRGNRDLIRNMQGMEA